MAKKAGVRDRITLVCSECKQRNYNTKKNKQNTPKNLNLKVLSFLRQTHASPRDEIMSLERRHGHGEQKINHQEGTFRQAKLVRVGKDRAKRRRRVQNPPLARV